MMIPRRPSPYPDLGPPFVIALLDTYLTIPDARTDFLCIQSLNFRCSGSEAIIILMSSSDEEEGRIAFTTEGDYDDGQWVGGEFFARGQRQGRHQTKEEAIYGYDDSDDDGYKGGGRKKKVSPYSASPPFFK